MLINPDSLPRPALRHWTRGLATCALCQAATLVGRGVFGGARSVGAAPYLRSLSGSERGAQKTHFASGLRLGLRLVRLEEQAGVAELDCNFGPARQRRR